ncbi:MAG TPA: hypothetical protein PKH39_16590, partial [Woeseiaceae bacterium]|nr:hypothetical protein [Woeseiaceae bacterium]
MNIVMKIANLLRPDACGRQELLAFMGLSLSEWVASGSINVRHAVSLTRALKPAVGFAAVGAHNAKKYSDLACIPSTS